MTNRRTFTIPHAWWTVILIAILTACVGLTYAAFDEKFQSKVPVTLTSERSGLVMEVGGKVKLRGVTVGSVDALQNGDPTRLRLEIFRDQLQFIPRNVQAEIRATTAFGAKYVDLIVPSDPSPARLAGGQIIAARSVSTEINTVFQDLMGVLRQVDPSKLNAVLSALADGFGGRGPVIGEATTAANDVLLALNPRSEAIRTAWRSVQGFSDTYGAAAQNLVNILDAASTTSDTIVDQANDLDHVLLGAIGMGNSGAELIEPNIDNMVTAVNSLQPTTSLLKKYNPELTCLLVGGKFFLDNGGYQAMGGNGRSFITDVGLLLGDDPYKYPENLPIVGAKGGPAGQPGCGSLPIVDNAFPKQYLVTNTGWGTGLDVRPNPGIGFPGYANYFPVTRAVPEPPSVRNDFGGPAPGPAPAYPGAPPYGAQLYAPDGTPLWPGLPPAVPSTTPPPDPAHAPPGSEPYLVPAPAQVIPTPLPPAPPPRP